MRTAARSRPGRPRRRARAGFTLLEVVLALAILATSAGALFSLMTARLDYAVRLEAHFAAVREAADLAATLRAGLADVRIERTEEVIEARATSLPDAPPLRVTLANMAINDVRIPVSDGLSPYLRVDVRPRVGTESFVLPSAREMVAP